MALYKAAWNGKAVVRLLQGGHRREVNGERYIGRPGTVMRLLQPSLFDDICLFIVLYMSVIPH
jgi:hypothetical protein